MAFEEPDVNTQPGGPTLEEILAGQIVQSDAQTDIQTQETTTEQQTQQQTQLQDSETQQQPQLQDSETQQQPIGETQPISSTQPDPLQQILAMQQQQQQLIGMLFNMMQQNQQPVITQPEPEIEQPVMEFTIPEELPEELQKEIDDLYLENPAKALAKVAKWQQEQVLKAQREAELKRQQAEAAKRQQLQQEYAMGFAALIKEHGPDTVEKLGPRIEEIMTKERPALLNLPPRDAIAIAFELARREQMQQPVRPQPQQQQQQILQDNQDAVSVLNQLLSQPEIRNKAKELIGNEVIANYLKGIQKGNATPAVIAGQPGTTVPVTPPNKFTTFDEAAEAMEKFFSR